MKKLALTLALSLTSTTAFAADTKLSGKQITELLSGATIKGLHYGTETRQYFSESGLTLYGCFDIAHDKEQNVHYFLGEDFRAPFIVNNGFELHFD